MLGHCQHGEHGENWGLHDAILDRLQHHCIKIHNPRARLRVVNNEPSLGCAAPYCKAGTAPIASAARRTGSPCYLVLAFLVGVIPTFWFNDGNRVAFVS